MHRLDLDHLRTMAPHLELDALVAPGAREVRATGKLRGRAVLVRFLTDPNRDPKRLVRLEASLATHGPLRGPGLVPVLEAHPEADPPYVVEQLVEGEALDAALARGAAPDVARAAGELAAALAVLAERRLVHGAVAPEHVRVGRDGALYLGGLASATVTLAEDDAQRAAQDAYAAPEALAGRGAGAPADVYALALVLCEVAAGRLLFASEAAGRVTPATRMAGWTPPADVDARLGAWLAPVVSAALHPKPEQRPGAAALFATATRPMTRPVGSLRTPAILVAAVLAVFAWQVELRPAKRLERRASPVLPAIKARPVAARALPAKLDELMAEGNRLLWRDEYRAAGQVFLRALELAPRHPGAWTGLANAREGLGDLQRAEISYRKAIELDPREAFATMRLAHVVDMRGPSWEAETLARRALELWPSYSCAKVQLIKIVGRGASETSKLLEALVQADPKHGHEAQHLGVVLWWLQDHERAEKFLRRGLEDIARVPGSWSTLACFLEERGRDEEALEVARKLLAREPGRAEAHAIVSRVLARRGDIKGAAAALERAQALDPDLPFALAEIARTLIQTNSTPERAGAILDHVLQMDPHRHSALEDRAMVRIDAGDLERGLQAARAGHNHRPFCETCEDLVQICEQMNGRRSIVYPPVVRPTQEYLLALQKERTDPAAARAHLARALARQPGNRLFQRLAQKLAEPQ